MEEEEGGSWQLLLALLGLAFAPAAAELAPLNASGGRRVNEWPTRGGQSAGGADSRNWLAPVPSRPAGAIVSLPPSPARPLRHNLRPGPGPRRRLFASLPLSLARLLIFIILIGISSCCCR
jgi:hypothetical protein